MSKNESMGIDTNGLIPAFSNAWDTLGADVQGKIVLILGIFMVSFILSLVIAVLVNGTKANISAIDKDSSARKSAIVNIGYSLAVGFVVVICLGLIFVFFY